VPAATAHAETTLTAIVHFTKVDNAYATLQEMYQRFHEQNPDITINFDFIDHDAYHTKMQALAVSGNLPNIMTLWPGKRTGYLTDRGYVRDLRDLIERDNIAASQKDVFLRAQGPGGEIYEMAQPFVNYSNVVYANDQLMQKLKLTFPKTLAEFKEQAKTIQAAGLTPVVYGDQSSWVMQSCLLSMLTARIGGLEWFDKARKGEGGASFNDSGFVNALQTVQDMVDSGLIGKGEPSLTREQALAAFVGGQSVYFIGGIWEVDNLRNALPADMKTQVSLHPFPEIEGAVVTGTASSSGALNTGYGMSKANTPEQVEAAWKWIKFNMDYKNADIVVKHGTLPVYKEGSIDNLIDDPLLKQSYKFSTGIDTVLPVIDDKMDAEGVNEIVNAGLQELILGGTTPKDLAAKYEAWVAANDSNRQH
jgi:raffinose/stachyose/melibiose transport system substrate-binding protein